jgi:hypothetical protein
MVAQGSQWSLSGENEGERADQRRPMATGTDNSERASDDSWERGRARLLGRVSSELADLAAAGDMTSRRSPVVNATVAWLLSSVQPVVDLGSGRARHVSQLR